MIVNSLRVATLGLLIPLAACNSDTTAKSVVASSTSTATNNASKASQPIPQPGGYSNIDNTKLQEFVKKGVTVVDIRRKEEWQQTGIVKGSKTITFFDHTGRINPNFVPEFTAVANPEQPVVLICRTGNRTQAASQAIAQQLGYKNVYNVTHGITSWIAEKRPVAVY